jgi:adenylylsulfate reductase, subunit A
MCIGQAGVWAGENIEPEKKNSELMPTEPYLLGSHSGCCGIWVSGPTDLGAPTSEDHAEADKVPGHLPSGWNWGYRSMTTVKGLFTAADGVGASGHKFSSGSHAEGRLAMKGMIKFVMDHPGHQPELDTPVEQLIEAICRPVRNFLEYKDYSTAIDVNPHYITPRVRFRDRVFTEIEEVDSGVVRPPGFLRYARPMFRWTSSEIGRIRSPGGWQHPWAGS